MASALSGKESFLEKPLDFSLAKSKVIFTREEDSEQSLVIRNLYELGKPNVKVFGLKQKDNISNLFQESLYLFQKIKADGHISKKIVSTFIWPTLDKAIVESEDDIDDVKDLFDELKKKEEMISIHVKV